MTEYWAKIYKINNVYARLSSNHPSVVTDLYNYLSAYAKNYKFMPKYKAGIWDGKIYFMERNGKFPIGLLKYVMKYVKQDGIELQVDKSLLQTYAVDDLCEVTNTWLLDNWIPLPHQLEGASQCLKYRRGILDHATSSGKSLTIAMVIMYALKKEICKKALVIVPSTGLVEQMASDFMSYGVPEEMIGKFWGGSKNFDTDIVISTWQSMVRQPAFVKEFDLVVCDEAHAVKAKEFNTVTKNVENAVIRIGCTGSVPEIKSERWPVEGVLGSVLHVIKTRELIDKGYASDVTIKIIDIHHPKEIKEKLNKADYEVEEEYVEKCDKRNNVASFIVKKHVEIGHNCLIITDHIAHIKLLADKIQEHTPHVFSITKDTKPTKREEIRKFVNENRGCVIIATPLTMSTGISINRLHAIVLPYLGKSMYRIVQTIGRGIRLHREKKRVVLYDMCDDLKYSTKHRDERLKIYTRAEFDIEVKEVSI